MSVFGIEPDRFTCSRAACGEPALWRIEWRNPKIHGTDRVKVWLACEEHVEYLREFLSARDFPVRTVKIDTAKTGTSESSTAESSTSESSTAEDSTAEDSTAENAT